MCLLVEITSMQSLFRISVKAFLENSRVGYFKIDEVEQDWLTLINVEFSYVCSNFQPFVFGEKCRKEAKFVWQISGPPVTVAYFGNHILGYLHDTNFYF